MVRNVGGKEVWDCYKCGKSLSKNSRRQCGSKYCSRTPPIYFCSRCMVACWEGRTCPKWTCVTCWERRVCGEDQGATTSAPSSGLFHLHDAWMANGALSFVPAQRLVMPTVCVWRLSRTYTRQLLLHDLDDLDFEPAELEMCRGVDCSSSSCVMRFAPDDEFLAKGCAISFNDTVGHLKGVIEDGPIRASYWDPKLGHWDCDDFPESLTKAAFGC